VCAKVEQKATEKTENYWPSLCLLSFLLFLFSVVFRVMTITIYIPAVLRNRCGGASELFLLASSIRAALEQIERSHPALYRSICDETGAVRRHVNLFVNTSHMRDREGLDTVLAPGDVVTVMPAVSGG
jgi:molybdopterin converting factor small subunit